MIRRSVGSEQELPPTQNSEKDEIAELGSDRRAPRSDRDALQRSGGQAPSAGTMEHMAIEDKTQDITLLPGP